MHLLVIGAGPVGLTTAAGLAGLGHSVAVHDTDPERAAALEAGRAGFFEPGLDDLVRAGTRAGRLRVATDGLEADADMSIVCVPTPLGADGVLSMAIVLEVVARLLDATGPQHTIVIRSTMPLDGPRRLVDLAAGRPARPAIVSNPEFMREGNAVADFDRPGRVVVGWLTEGDQEAARRVAALYAPLGAPTIVVDAGSAALLKLATNAFLALKIGFANEVARLADALDADAGVVADGLGLDPRIGRAFLSAGPGFGGSCLPEQAIAIGREARRHDVPTELLDALGRANETHQRAIVDRLDGLLGGLEARCVAVLGLAFKAGTDDVRASPGLALAKLLRASGAAVVGHDPRAGANAAAADARLPIAREPGEAAAGADAVVVATEWPDYGVVDWSTVRRAMRGDLVFDTRAVVDGAAVRAAGLRLVQLGRPSPAAAGTRQGSG